jgi:hypothetical protein
MRLSDIQEDVLYFNRTGMFAILDMQRKESDKAIDSIDTDTLLNTPTNDVVVDIVDKYKLEVPILSRDEAHMDPPREVTMTIQDYGRTIHPTGTLLTLHVPFTGDAGMFWVQPSTYDSGPPRGTLNGQELILRMRGTKLEPAAVEKHFNSTLDVFERYFNWQRTSVDQFLTELTQRARQTIEARKARLLADRNMVASLPFRIKARGESTQTYVAPLKRKQMVFQRKAVSESFKPEPTLDEGDYQHILKVIEGMTRTMERSPSTFAKLDEEALRDMYLVPLNGHLEGAATGETFNAEGKTDILIRVEDRNIFIAECKIWRGPKYLTEAIDQLLSYLTWRDTKTAIIVFNRNKGLSAV